MLARVDDNGAGVAAMLEVARQMGNQTVNGVKRSNTMIFLASDLEEYGRFTAILRL